MKCKIVKSSAVSVWGGGISHWGKECGGDLIGKDALEVTVFHLTERAKLPCVYQTNPDPEKILRNQPLSCLQKEDSPQKILL